MKNSDKWQPSKFVRINGKLMASRDRKEVGVASRLVTDIVASFYDRNIKDSVKGSLLDLGCGTVPLYNAYKDYVTDNVCVDWENSLHNSEYIDFECNLSNKLPFKDLAFDTIIISDVLEHIPNPGDLWKEMARVLSVNGRIILNVPFYYWVHERPHDYYRYTEFALRRFVEDSNLKLVQFESMGGSPEIVADILAKHCQFIPLIGSPLAIGIQYMSGLFVKTSFGKKVSRKSSEVFPFGYFLIAEKE